MLPNFEQPRGDVRRKAMTGREFGTPADVLLRYTRQDGDFGIFCSINQAERMDFPPILRKRVPPISSVSRNLQLAFVKDRPLLFSCIALPFGWKLSPIYYTKFMGPLTRLDRQNIRLRIQPYMKYFLVAVRRRSPI